MLPNCPKCQSSYTYKDQDQLICPECAHEWREGDEKPADENKEKVIKDSNGQILQDGDTVVVIKD